MSELFSIQLQNRQQSRDGVWLDLPTTTEQVQAALRQIDISSDNPQGLFISGYFAEEEKRFAIPYNMVLASNVDELNFLAARLETLSAGERAELNAALQAPQSELFSIGKITDFPENVEYYVHLPEVRGPAQLGDYYLNRSGMVDMPEEWKGGIDTAQFGRYVAQQEQGAFTEYGYLVKSGDVWQKVHEGQPVPEEYRVLSFPAPEVLRDSANISPPIQSEPQLQKVLPIILNGKDSAERMKEITDRLETGIQELFDSDRYKAYLTTMAKFHNYSFNNTLLIAMQGGQLVAGFNKWKDTFHRTVKKGEKGIKILAPAPYKVKQKIEKLDEQGKPILGKDGKPLTEEKTVQIPAFKVVSVFDVSQTEGEPLPTIAVNELSGSVQDYQDFFKALEQSSPVPIGFEDIEGGAHGYFHLLDNRIAIQEGMSQLQTIKTAIHEIAHAKLHAIDPDDPEQANRPDSRTREVQAESVAYAVCQHYGLDTSEYSFGYVAGWSSGRELAELKASLEVIRSTAHELISALDEHLAELRQQREADLSAAQETAFVLDSGNTLFIQTCDSGYDYTLYGPDNKALDAAQHTDREKDGYTGGWYDKTSFRIDFTMNGQPDNYEGRQDFGDGEGSLVQHIQNYHEYYAKDENWKNFVLHNKGTEAWEQDKAEREMVLTEFIPYLKQHCNLSAMEQTATAALREEQNISPEQTAYYNAVVTYVQDCRPLLNQGQYNLPEPPKLADFDQTLQNYKAQVQAEIAQEAAAAGMTVEEYAAASFEAPQQDSFSIYQLRNEDSTRDYRFEPYDRLQAAGRTVDKANYTEVYTAPLAAGTTLEDIYRTFNVDYPADFKGHSLSVSDVVVLHQNGQDTAHYCDSVGFQQVPEFLRKNPLRTAELSTEQNENMIDGVLNNAPSLGELEAKAKAGEQISLTDLAAAVKAEEKAPKAKKSRTAKPKKPSIRAQLDAAKKEQSKQTQPREKTKELEV